MSGQISLSSPVEVKDSDAEIRLKEAHEGFVRTRMNIVLLNCNRWRNRIQRIQSADSVGPNSPFVGGSRSFNIEESPYVRIRQIIQSADSVGPNSPFVGGSRSSNIEESPIIHNYTLKPFIPFYDTSGVLIGVGSMGSAVVEAPPLLPIRDFIRDMDPNSPFFGGSRSSNIELSPFIHNNTTSNIEESAIKHGYNAAPPDLFAGANLPHRYQWADSVRPLIPFSYIEESCANKPPTPRRTSFFFGGTPPPPSPPPQPQPHVVIIVGGEQEPTSNTSTSWSELAKLLLPLAVGALLNSPSTYSANALPPLYFYAIMVLLVVAVLALLSSLLHKTSPNPAKVKAMVGTACVLATIPTLAAGLIPSG